MPVFGFEGVEPCNSDYRLLLKEREIRSFLYFFEQNFQIIVSFLEKV